jgi:DNA-binding transcriptional regulator YiaG
VTRAEFRKIRLSLGLTQEALARRLGVKLETVSRWERGALMLPKIAQLAIKQVSAEDKGTGNRSGKG